MQMCVNEQKKCETLARDPLSVGMAIAERFMKIDPPPKTYMYGVGLVGLLDLCEAGGDRRLLDFVLDHWQKTGGKGHFNPQVYRLTGDPEWLNGAKEAEEVFLTNPRKDREGALLDPRGRYTVDIVSGYVPRPIVYGHFFKDSRFFDEAYRQLEINRGYLEDPATGLWYSRWGHGLHPHRPNPGLWGRGNGWLVAAWGKAMHLWDPAHPRYEEALALWQRFCRAQADFQTPSGLFRQLMNRPWSFEDATGSGLIASGIAYGVLHGTLPAEMGAVAYRAVEGLKHLVDDEGNIHNVSTTAGGYNFEQQYETCAAYNEAHGDGTVMSACAAVHQLLQQDVPFDRTPPAEEPVIVTTAVPGRITFWMPDQQDLTGVARPVLQRMLSLDAVPELDRQGSTILGLLRWFDGDGDANVLEKARQLFERNAGQLETVARWRVAGELARRTADQHGSGGLVEYVDGYLAGVSRDREGLILDESGGYAIERLYNLLPLLGLAGSASGMQKYLDEACAQVLGYREWLEEPISQLWHAAYGRGAHPRRVTPGFWALGNAYCVAGVVDLLDHLPRDHAQYVDVVCLLRDLVKPLHEWLPVFGGWPQLLTDFRGFRCTAANGLLTYATGKAVLHGWVKSAYIAATLGGLYFLGELVKSDGAYEKASLPTGGLDTAEAYEQHYVTNDPYALGFILSGYAATKACNATGIRYGAEDTRLGAR